jgi:hypothetical protein
MSFVLTGLLLFVFVGVPLVVSGWVIISDFAQELFEDIHTR